MGKARFLAVGLYNNRGLGTYCRGLLLLYSEVEAVCTRPEGGNLFADVLSALTAYHQAERTHSLSPPTGASQADRECGEQRYVPAAHHLQRLQSCQVKRKSHSHTKDMMLNLQTE